MIAEDYLLEAFDRPIAYHKSFAQITGSVATGVMLSQLVYWSKRTTDADGWFYKIQAEWQEETALTRTEQETARKKLKALGILEEKKVGIPCKLYFRVSTKELQNCLQLFYSPVCNKAADRQAGILQAGKQQSRRQASRNLADNLYTEITPENTTKTTSERNMEREPLTPISQAEIVLDEEPESDQLIIQKTTNSLTVKNSDLQIKKDVPALVRVESKHAETIADKLRRIYHETGILPKIPMEIDVMVQAELGDQIVALYRTSGRITTRSRGDISLDFANYVTEQNKSGQNPDVNYGYSYIRKLEWGDDGRKRDWEVLAVLVAKWQAAKATGDRNLNIAKEVQRASKPKIVFTGKL